MKTEIEKCPKCRSKEHIKAGFTKNKQRYKCKSCGYYYSVRSVTRKKYIKDPLIRRRAIELYLEGVGSYRTIGKLLGISYGTVYRWIKQLEKVLDLPVKKEKIKWGTQEDIFDYYLHGRGEGGVLVIELKSNKTLIVEAANSPTKNRKKII
ncbi:MAG: helix-turn-helix domain-containing protein [Bacteroidales bacterium]|jgi:transposase-like protein|nr:helix-turn-helix domain-containing protein [Bacteroidales bacterium]